MTLKELYLIKKTLTDIPFPYGYGKQRRDYFLCLREEALKLVDREINLKTMDPVK